MAFKKVYIPHDEPLISGFGSAVAIAKKPTKAKTLKKEERRKYILHIFVYLIQKCYVLLTLMMKAEKLKNVKCTYHFIAFHLSFVT